MVPQLRQHKKNIGENQRTFKVQYTIFCIIKGPI